jgi:hypothetical protein
MNSNSEIYSKYIKYKNKYINLQNKINLQQSGGSALSDSSSGGSALAASSGYIKSESTDAKTFLKLKESDEIKSTITTYTFGGKNIHLINIELNKDESKPVLFMVGGLSNRSFGNSSKILLDKLDVLTNKFKNIYMIEYASFYDDQVTACGLRDSLDKTENDIYKPELDMNSEIADNVHRIIEDLRLNDVHLLGKCNGAWITILLLLKSSIYTALYLAVPGIPLSIKILETIDEKRLQAIKFIFGWTKQDGFEFNWQNTDTRAKTKSFQEKKRYDEDMEKIAAEKRIELRYESFMYDNGGPEEAKESHEIHPDMIDYISK